MLTPSEIGTAIVLTGGVLAVLWQWVIRPLLALARKADDVETIRAALTPNHGTSVADVVASSRRGIDRLEEALAEHCRRADARMAEMAEHIAATNHRLDRALEIIAGAPVRADDPPRCERTRAGD